MGFNEKSSLTEDSFVVLTIGTFDGVHIGHQKILNKVINLSKKYQYKSVVLTLFPHPRMVLQKDESIQLLNTIDERIDILNEMGIDEVVVKKFTEAFANMSARDYVEHILTKELKAKIIVIGYDHHFGKNRSANIQDLRAFSKEFDFEIEEISAQDIKDVIVSSTKIRNALDDGNVSLANSFLGYPYFLSGEVVKGKSLGRTIDFPTANIKIKENYKLIPKDGVYVVKSKIDDKIVFGMMNIGTNPTVDGKNKYIEVHFFDFSADIYGKKLKIEMLVRLRDERKFGTVELLKRQLEKDETDSKKLIDSLK